MPFNAKYALKCTYPFYVWKELHWVGLKVDNNLCKRIHEYRAKHCETFTYSIPVRVPVCTNSRAQPIAKIRPTDGTCQKYSYQNRGED